MNLRRAFPVIFLVFAMGYDLFPRAIWSISFNWLFAHEYEIQKNTSVYFIVSFFLKFGILMLKTLFFSYFCIL